ncbi:hypothetical protein ACOMHN_009048 [Nucella lapillus]
MVLVTAAEEEHHHQRLVIACGDHRPDMAQSAHTTTTPPSSPSEGGSPRSADLVQREVQSPQSPSSQSQQHGGPLAIADLAGSTSPPFSHGARTTVKQEEGEGEGGCTDFVVSIKQEQNMDAPLDFSIKRSHPDCVAADNPPSRLSPDTSLQPQRGQPGARPLSNGSGADDVEEDASPSPRPSPLPSGDFDRHVAPSAASLAALGLLADGSGAAVMPGVLSAVLGQSSGVAGLVADPPKGQGGSGGKAQRPFKAYPKEVLKMPLGYLGLPGVTPFPGLDAGYLQSLQGMSVLPEQLVAMYKQQADLLKASGKKAAAKSPLSSSPLSPHSTTDRIHVTHTSPPPSSASQQTSGTRTDSSSPGVSAESVSPPLSLTHSPDTLPGDHDPAPSPSCQSTAPLVTSTSSAASGGSRKRPSNFPDLEKDEAYWERRRKNNDAAKRSRDARRAKEDDIAIRAALLEQENLRLRVEVATLKTETARLRCLLYKT